MACLGQKPCLEFPRGLYLWRRPASSETLGDGVLLPTGMDVADGAWIDDAPTRDDSNEGDAYIDAVAVTKDFVGGVEEDQDV